MEQYGQHDSTIISFTNLTILLHFVSFERMQRTAVRLNHTVGKSSI